MVDGSMVLQMSESVSMRKVHGEVVLLDMESEQYYGLNAVGACVIDALCTGVDVDVAVNAVMAAFDAPEDQIRADVTALIDDLIETGLLVVTTK